MALMRSMIMSSQMHSFRKMHPLISKGRLSTKSTAAGDRPFRILGLQQIAIGNESKDTLTKLWVEMLGLKRSGTFRSEKENVDEDILVLGSGHTAVEVDLMQPIDVTKSPKVNEPALNHIGLWVDDIRAAVEHLQASGVRFTPGGIRKGAAGHDVTFIHPKGNEKSPIGGAGVLIELVQAPAEVIKAFEAGQNSPDVLH